MTVYESLMVMITFSSFVINFLWIAVNLIEKNNLRKNKPLKIRVDTKNPN